MWLVYMRTGETRLIICVCLSEFSTNRLVGGREREVLLLNFLPVSVSDSESTNSCTKLSLCDDKTCFFSRFVKCNDTGGRELSLSHSERNERIVSDVIQRRRGSKSGPQAFEAFTFC
jgi:hypothetical protein